MRETRLIYHHIKIKNSGRFKDIWHTFSARDKFRILGVDKSTMSEQNMLNIFYWAFEGLLRAVLAKIASPLKNYFNTVLC